MCVAFLSVGERLVLASNRDEFLERPAAPAAEWIDAPGIFGGRDLKEGGTWLALGRGRLGFVTNYRDPRLHREGRRSRGELVPRFLLGHEGAEAFLERLAGESDEYNPFNLVLAERPAKPTSQSPAQSPGEAWFFSSRERRARRLGPGIYGVSNGDFGAPWPKVVEGTRRFGEILARSAGGEPPVEPLFALMEDRSLAPDELLPSTGVPREVEKALSAIFIRRPGYGTRCSTLVTMGPEGGRFVERTYDDAGRVSGTVERELPVLHDQK